MNTCDTCKWWMEGDALKGRCESAKSLTYEEVMSGKEIPEDWVETGFNDSDQAQFLTGPKFGCVHWESKE